MAVLVTLMLLSGGILAQAISTNNSDGTPAWANPTIKALKLIGQAPYVLDQPNFQSNLDCINTQYRMVGSSDIKSGCFMQTAYGLFDPDDEIIIFNSTDEALPLNVFLTNQVITPWPGSLDALSLVPSLTDGTYLGLYRNLLSGLVDNRNLFQQITAKSLISPPDIMFRNSDSTLMVINPQTISFSSGGSWLVAETLAGSFIRFNLATLDMQAFAPAFGYYGGQVPLKSQVAISTNGQYVAIENNIANSFKVYDLSTCKTVNAGLVLDCKSYEYWPYLSSKIVDLRSIRHLRFINHGLLSFVADYRDGSNVFELAPYADISTFIQYLALGDSYASGEGAFDYLPGTDSELNNCHLSVKSYPLIISEQLYGSGGHSVACSGAKIGDILPSNTDKYKGQASDKNTQNATDILSNYKPGYLAQSDFVSHYQPANITLSVGGNDLGFADILKSCVIPHLSLHSSDGVCYNSYEDRLELKNMVDKTVPRWSNLFKQIKAKSPMSRIFVTGYPQIFYDKGDCGLNVNLSKSELEFSAEFTDYIDGAIHKAALESGVYYVDVSDAFNGYRLCEAASYSVAVNGLTAGRDGGILGLKIFGSESYHPNAFGQSLLSTAILNKTNHFKVESIGTVLTESDNLLNSPKSGRKTRALIPASLGKEVIYKKQVNNVSIDGVKTGLATNSIFKLTLDNDKLTIVNGLVPDASGAISTSYILPESAAGGVHSLDLIGLNQVGEEVDIKQTIYVGGDIGDIDGDGISDSQDSCPLAINSGVDQDGDKIDDVCDPYIGASSQSPSNPKDLKIITQTRDSGSTPSYSSGVVKSVVDAKSSISTVSLHNIDKPTIPYKNSVPRMPNTKIYSHNYSINLGLWLSSTARLSEILALLLVVFWSVKIIWSGLRRRFLGLRRKYSLKGGTAITYS